MSEWGNGAIERARELPTWLRTVMLAVVAVLLLAVAAAALDRAQGPTDSDCATQRIEVMSGERGAVEDGCR